MERRSNSSGRVLRGSLGACCPQCASEAAVHDVLDVCFVDMEMENGMDMEMEMDMEMDMENGNGNGNGKWKWMLYLM